MQTLPFSVVKEKTSQLHRNTHRESETRIFLNFLFVSIRCGRLALFSPVVLSSETSRVGLLDIGIDMATKSTPTDGDILPSNCLWPRLRAQSVWYRNLKLKAMAERNSMDFLCAQIDLLQGSHFLESQGIFWLGKVRELFENSGFFGSCAFL